MSRNLLVNMTWHYCQQQFALDKHISKIWNHLVRPHLVALLKTVKSYIFFLFYIFLSHQTRQIATWNIGATIWDCF